MEAKKRTGMNYGLMALMGLVGVLAFGTMAASAAGLTDLPGQFGAVLGVSADAGGILLSASVMVAVGLVMAVAKQPLVPTIIILVAVMCALTAIGWIEYWLIVLTAIVFAAMFGKRMADVYTGGGAQD